MQHLHERRYKTIVVSVENYLILKKLGGTADSFNDVLSKILKERNAGLQYAEKELEL